MKKITAFFCAAAMSSLLLAACSKENEKSTLHLRLTDAPLSVEEVNVEILEVRVNMTGPTPSDSPEESSNGWIKMETNKGIYNLLELQNGIDTLIGSALLPTGTVHEIRFVLGSQNTIKENGVVYPLVIPSGSSSGLKIKVDKKLKADLETLLIDFDAALSIKKEGTGDYKLRPVLKVK
ncbi:MAG: DUF4382 domain-containing protein [Bacteroidota bacterium]|nr:DUF4382 domain-containing protein [Ferruginibacter sp.]